MKFHADENTCSCCEGIEALTPLSTASRPGLPALAYRIGTHAAFLETMLARMSSMALEVDDNGVPVPWQGAGATGCRGTPTPTDPCAASTAKHIFPLGQITTRRPDDLSIALLDAWALVADVLTFYQARIANEGYLGTAVERRSVQELARLVGYKLRPGLAASVYLSFTLDKDFQTDIPAGTRVLSVPQGKELSQTFETVEPFTARYAWNAIPANTQRPQYIAGGNIDQIERIFVEGLGTQLKPNDPLLFVFGENQGEQAARLVQRIEPVVVIEPIAGAGYTIVELQAREGIEEAQTLAARHADLAAFGVSPTTLTAQRISRRLQNLSRARSRESAAREVTQLLQIVDTPLLNPGAALTSWLNNLKAGFQPLSDRLNRQPQAVRALATGKNTFPFLAQATAQAKEPNLRFATGKDLPRSVTTLLGPGSETIPKMITRLKPRMEKTFYAAWGSAQAAPDSPLQQVAALRVKAAPFGHNASLKPVYDSRGTLIDQVEWPLRGEVTFGITIPPPSGGGPVILAAGLPNNAEISLRAAGQTYRRIVPIGQSTEIELPVGVLNVEFPDDMTRTFRFAGQNIERQIRFEIHDAMVRIFIDGDEIADLAEDQIDEVFLNARHRVRVAYHSAGVEVTDESFSPADRMDVIDLDFAYDQIVSESWVLIDRPIWARPRAFQVLNVQWPSINAYGISGKTTRLELSGDWLTADDLMLSDIRETTVYAQSEPLTLVDERYDDPPVQGSEILLDGLYDGLESGRWIYITGERVDIPGAQGVEDVELAMIASVLQGVPSVDVPDGSGGFTSIPRPGSKTLTTLVLAQPLDHAYKRKTVKIYANVTKATHGETQREILGSGDARKAHKIFPLRQSPLTYLPAATPSGATSTLELRVNNVRWPEMDNLLFLGKTDRGYELRREDDGKKDLSSAVTGDGWHGARPPTGIENIDATYRSGLGKDGNVAADTLRNLVIRPLGVKFVTNPQRATGGADRDDRDSARQNAPLAVMALDRLVSASDYASFARMFAGIGKATAKVFPRGRGKLVHVTIAGKDNIPIDRNSDLLRMLIEAMRRYGDPTQPFEVGVRELLLLMISAGVHLTGEIPWVVVEEQIRDRLRAAFGFNHRELGQDVYLSEIEAVIENAPGVDYIDIDFLDALSEEEALDENQLLARLPGGQSGALPPRPKKGIDVMYARPGGAFDILPAQLAILSPDIDDTLILTELP